MSGGSHPRLRPCVHCNKRTRSLYQICADCSRRNMQAIDKKMHEKLELSRQWLTRSIRDPICDPGVDCATE